MGSQESRGTRKPGMKKKWQLGAVFQQLEGNFKPAPQGLIVHSQRDMLG
jgi:hypothetical protein